MSAIVLRQTEQVNIQRLHFQLMSGGILQRELWEEAEKYLLYRGIYDVTLIEEKDFQEYKKILINDKGYVRKSAIRRTAALRTIQKYWVEKEFGELLAEIESSDVSEPRLKGNIKRFLIRQGIHHIRDIDYQVRKSYESDLLKTRRYEQALKYLKVFDHIKQQDIQKEMGSLAGMARNRMKYKNQILFLPYLPDQKLAREFEYVQDKKELVWDFARTAPEQLKRQVFYLLTYILENLYQDNPKERRVRYLLPLHWLYDFCVEECITDLECLEMDQIQQFEKIVEKRVVNVKNALQIIDNSRRILFLAAPEIHWHANVWYMERFHLTEERLNPSNPVKRLTFIDVVNRKNREILQKYAQYHVGIGNLTIANIRQQLYEIKRLLQYFDDEESICKVNTEQLDSYFKMLDEKDTKAVTFNAHIAHIQKFYEFLKINAYIKEIPFRVSYYYKKTFPEHHDRTVEESVYMEILSKLHTFPIELRLIFLHLWCTGLRISEVCTLKGAAYFWDGEDAWLKVYQIKMKADKMIPIPIVLYKIMQTYINRRHISPKEYIFKAQDGKGYRYGTFMKSFKRDCEEYGIANSEYVFRSHDYRHTLATRFYENRVSLQTIRDYEGHYSEEMTKQYVDYLPKKIEKANEEFYAKAGNNLGAMITVKRRGEKHDKKDLPK